MSSIHGTISTRTLLRLGRTALKEMVTVRHASSIRISPDVDDCPEEYVFRFSSGWLLILPTVSFLLSKIVSNRIIRQSSEVLQKNFTLVLCKILVFLYCIIVLLDSWIVRRYLLACTFQSHRLASIFRLLAEACRHTNKPLCHSVME